MIVPRAEVDPEVWNAFVETHPWGWFWHTAHWIDYCLAYWPDAVDHSFAVLEGYEIRAVVPLVQEGTGFTMGGHPGADPLVVDADLTPEIMTHVATVARQAAVRRWAVRSMPSAAEPGPVQLGWQNISWRTHVVDVTQSEPDLWRRMRRSYHALVHRAEHAYDLVESAGPWAVDRAQAVHVAAAGRETRSRRTWELMADWATRGFVVTALASTTGATVPSGMALAIRYKRHAYYASGATLDPDLSHALIWHLIQVFRTGALRSFELGWAARPQDAPKDRGIAFFKSGFGGDLWHVPAVETLL